MGMGSSMTVDSLIGNCQSLRFDWTQGWRRGGSHRLQKNLVVDIIKRGFQRQDEVENRRPITNNQ